MSRQLQMVCGSVAAIVLIGVLAACGTGGDNVAESTVAQTTTTTTANGFTLPDYAGKTLDVALEELKTHGIKVESVDTVDDKTVLSPKNWVIENHTPAAGVAVTEGGTVIFNVSKPGAAEAKVTADAAAAASSKAAADLTATQAAADKAAAEVAASEAANPETTPSGLTASKARTACNSVGEAQFPYGYKASWIIGRLAEEVQGDQWFLQVETKVTNAFNAKAKGLVTECYVGGTDGGPIVTSFRVF